MLFSVIVMIVVAFFFFFQAEDGIRDVERSRGLGDVYKRQVKDYSIEFENVSFAYESNEVLKNISFAAKEGTVTALVGPSGAGKTTIGLLTARFWDINKGKILLGGIDIRDMNQSELMNAISYVFQDLSLIHI
eukprot:TRINITY_DN19326_c0_g1_i2.p2 TRINITY_DN19326_c0_g1~~TRINITY_DN19326_c0_g1_i2.p2  ORF type:complete len:133 (-),score=30.54 TRINITY_DN19326_c0_g1_i2:125-523(-)